MSTNKNNYPAMRYIKFTVNTKKKYEDLLKIIKDINVDVKDKVVLIVEDIIDSGRTMANLKEIFKVRQCKAFKICTLLNKKEREITYRW